MEFELERGNLIGVLNFERDSNTTPGIGSVKFDLSWDDRIPVRIVSAGPLPDDVEDRIHRAVSAFCMEILRP